MSADLEAPGLRSLGVAHGFAGRDRAVAPGLHLVRARQVHGAAIAWADEATASPAGDLDALATDRAGVAVAIATADCVPILIAAVGGPRVPASNEPGVAAVAAVHAGWRGTLAAIAEATADALVRRTGAGPADLRVAIGPAIGGCCYEVEREIAERFAARFGPEVWNAWRDGFSGKGTLDLRALNRVILLRAGVPDAAIEIVGPCTFCGDGPFASFRRDGANAGRQLSWIGMPEPDTRPNREPDPSTRSGGRSGGEPAA